MGGIGSGRHWHCGAKDTTDDYRTIDIRRWKRDGLLEPRQSFSLEWSRHGEIVASIWVLTEPERVELIYRHKNRSEQTWRDQRYSVYLDWTPCHLGGERPWFICPEEKCGRRVAILYSGRIFACRNCHQLAYSSQRESVSDRAARRANKIRERLGWKKGILNPKGWRKPKGMHWRTFKRLNTKHDALVAISLKGITAWLNRFGVSVDD